MDLLDVPVENIPAVQIMDAFIAELRQSRSRFSLKILQTLHERLNIGVSLVRHTTNSRCAVNKLPPEILGLIFQHVSSQFGEEIALWEYSYQNPDEILPLTRVCHHWRDVALGLPALWTNVKDEYNDPYNVARALSYSRGYSLKIYVDCYRPNSSMEQLFSSDGSRFKELHFFDCCSYTMPNDATSPMFPFLPSQLEYLTISHTTDLDINVPGTQLSPLTTLFQTEAPNLKTIILKNVSWLPTDHFVSLMRLCICSTFSPIQWTGVDLIGFISLCPNLQDIVLDGFLPFLKLPNHSMESITLRALRRLSIGAPNHAFIRFDCVAVIRWFLEHIISPAGSLTRIYGLRETELCVLDDLRLATVNRAERAHIQILSSSIHITACGSSSGIRVESEIESPEFVLPFFPASAAVDIQELWFSVVRSRRPYCMESQFDVISAMFPGVTTLVLLHDVPLDALLPPDTGAPLFPALDSLRIYQDTNFFQALPLVYVAKKRAEHGYRIRHLVVQRKAHPYSTSSGWDADGKVQEGDWSVDTSNDEQREVEFIHHALSAYVDIVEVATCEQPPSMEVPDYCNEYPHRYWPAW